MPNAQTIYCDDCWWSKRLWRDPGLIQGRCKHCGKVIYSRTTAASCHRAGKWMRERWEGADSLAYRIRKDE